MQMKLTCPHCGQRAMTGARKLGLGPAFSAACRSCGKKLSVPKSATAACIPLLASAGCHCRVDLNWVPLLARPAVRTADDSR